MKFLFNLIIIFIIYLSTPVHSGNLPANIDFKIYGFINASLLYTDKNPAYITQYKANPDFKTGDLNFNAHTSRFGINIFALIENDIKVQGRFEIDFAGEENAVSNARIQIKQAYGKADYKDWNFIFGQTEMIISQTEPAMLNAGALIYGGNLFVRLPQFRITKKINSYIIEAGILRQSTDVRYGIPKSQERQLRYQCRISKELDFLVFNKAQFALGADYYNYSGDTDACSAFNFEFVLPYKKSFKIIGELFSARNAGDLGGSIYSESKMSAVEGYGGYIQLTKYFSEKFYCNAGYGLARNKPSTITDLEYKKNEPKFINFGYNVTSRLLLCAELFDFKSTLKNNTTYTANRYQFSTLFFF